MKTEPSISDAVVWRQRARRHTPSAHSANSAAVPAPGSASPAKDSAAAGPAAAPYPHLHHQRSSARPDSVAKKTAGKTL